MHVSMNKVDHTAVVVTNGTVTGYIRFQSYNCCLSPCVCAGVSIDQELMDTECIQPIYTKDVVQLSQT